MPNRRGRTSSNAARSESGTLAFHPAAGALGLSAVSLVTVTTIGVSVPAQSSKRVVPRVASPSGTRVSSSSTAPKYVAAGSVTTSRASSRAARKRRPRSSSRNRSGPAMSTRPFVGAPTATSRSAAATSSAAIGWISTCASRTVEPSVAESSDAGDELEELGRVHERPGDRGALDELLLGDLRAEVPALGQPLRCRRRTAPRGGGRRRRPRRPAGCGSRSRRTPGPRPPRRTASSTRRRRRRRRSSTSASPSPVRVLTPVPGDAATASWPSAASSVTSFEPMSPVPPMTTIFMGEPPVSVTSDALATPSTAQAAQT